MNFNKIIVFFSCTFLFFSCTQSLDFNQASDFSASPVFTTSLLYFKTPAARFIDTETGAEIVRFEEESEFDLFQGSFFRDNLVKVVFNFEVQNTFNKDVILEVKFLNQNDVIVYQFEDLYVTAGNVDFKQEEIIELSMHPDFFDTAKTNLSVSLAPSPTPLDTSENHDLEFQSSFTLHIETK